MSQDASKPSVKRSAVLKRTWSRLILQCGAILIVATVSGLTVNSLRSDRLPLVADGSATSQPSGIEDPFQVSFDEAMALFFAKAAIFVDARSTELFHLGHIQGARNLPWEEFEERFQEVMTDIAPASMIITYCDGESCDLSKNLAFGLLEKGFVNVRVLVNGWALWQQAELPTEK